MHILNPVIGAIKSVYQERNILRTVGRSAESPNLHNKRPIPDLW